MTAPSKKNTPVAVASCSFSGHPLLREEILKQYSDVKFNQTGRPLSRDEVVEFLKGFELAITGLETLDDAVLTLLPELRVVSKYGVGLDMIDLDALERRGVRLGYTSGVNRRSVAELALCFILALLHQVQRANIDLREGIWKRQTGILLSNKTVGIVGCGNVGKELIQLLEPFRCRILSYDILEFPEFYAAQKVESVSLETLLKLSDVVSLHVPLDCSTRMLMNEERLSWMKRGAILINTARGSIVDEHGVQKKLEDGSLSGVAFDVYQEEPPGNLELLRHPRFLGTPHMGASTEEAILAMGRAAILGLESTYENS